MKHIFTASFIVLFLISARTYASCIESTSAGGNKVKTINLSWIKSEQLIYGLDDQGLYEVHLNSSSRKKLFDIKSKYQRGLILSPNGKYLLLVVSDDEHHGVEERYLYNVSSNRGSKIQGLPRKYDPGQLEFVGFSPDSSYIAWQDNKDFNSQDENRGTPSLLVYSTNKIDRQEFIFPAYFSSSNNLRSCFTSQWGIDGNYIYSNFINSKYTCALEKEDRHKLIYFKTDIKTGAITRIEGGYEFNEKKFSFRNYYKENNNKIELTYPCNRRNCSGGPYISGGNEAVLNSHTDLNSKNGFGTEDLIVTLQGEKPIKIEKGHVGSLCTDPDIEIISWLDKGKYLIYRFNDKTYIYGALEKRKSLLPQLSGIFDWMPPSTRDVIYIQGSGRKSSLDPMLYTPSHMNSEDTMLN